MFGASNAFGQSSNSTFGSASVFGQTSNGPFGSPAVFGHNNANNNPFAAKAFGTTSPFGAQTGSSTFGGTSTGVFGTPASSPIFGASSSPAFGSSMPAFGETSSTAFGAASSSPFFGGSTAFVQKPAFGAFGSTSTPTSSPFGSTFTQSQPAFGSTPFGSSNFGAGSQPAFGTASPSPFGTASTSPFGTASTPAFGTASTPAFGNTGSAFGVSNSPFGSSTPAFGVSSTPAFGAPSGPVFGSSATTTFGSSGSAFSFQPSSAFGQPTASAFSSGQFTAQSSPFGSQATTSSFGTPFAQTTSANQQRPGSRATAYAQTPEIDRTTGTQTAGKLESISAMPVYKEKSHEELRWEDYQAGDKGGPNPAGQSSGGMGFNTNNTQPNPFSPSPSFTQPAANLFSSTPSTNPFAPKTSTFGTPTLGFAGLTPAVNSSPFGTPQSNPFASTLAQTTPSLFSSTPTGANQFSSNPSNPFVTAPSSSPFGTQTSAFGTPTSLFGTTQAQGTTPSFGGMGFNTNNTQSNPFSPSPAPGQTSSPFRQPPFVQAGPYHVYVAQTGGIGGFNQNSFEQMFTNLYGALQAMRQMTTTAAGEPGPMRLSCVSSNDISVMMLEFQNLKL